MNCQLKSWYCKLSMQPLDGIQRTKNIISLLWNSIERRSVSVCGNQVFCFAYVCASFLPTLVFSSFFVCLSKLICEFRYFCDKRFITFCWNYTKKKEKRIECGKYVPNQRQECSQTIHSFVIIVKRRLHIDWHQTPAPAYILLVLLYSLLPNFRRSVRIAIVLYRKSYTCIPVSLDRVSGLCLTVSIFQYFDFRSH